MVVSQATDYTFFATEELKDRLANPDAYASAAPAAAEAAPAAKEEEKAAEPEEDVRHVYPLHDNCTDEAFCLNSQTRTWVLVSSTRKSTQGFDAKGWDHGKPSKAGQSILYDIAIAAVSPLVLFAPSSCSSFSPVCPFKHCHNCPCTT